MSCPICCESFNKRARLAVECGCVKLLHQRHEEEGPPLNHVRDRFCSKISCRSCVQTYLVNTFEDPHCMQCKHAWDREFIDQSCTKVFRENDLKKHRENVLFEREKCLLPEAQEVCLVASQPTFSTMRAKALDDTGPREPQAHQAPRTRDG